MTLVVILLIAALVCFLLAAFGVGGRIAFGWIGLALLTVVQLLPALGV